MQFYVVRFLLGVAEAGFFPGIIVYFTHWFPMRERALAMSGLVVAIPISLAIGAPVSALLLDVTGWARRVGMDVHPRRRSGCGDGIRHISGP